MNSGAIEQPDDRTSPMRMFAFIASVNGFLAVALGAFGTHVLRHRISREYLVVWDTGTRYHLTHAVALLAVALLIGPFGDSIWLRRAGWLFTWGMALFSGSLYVLAVTGVRMFGAITPLGGLCLLGGWACLALASRSPGIPSHSH